MSTLAQAQVLPDQFTIEGRLFLSGTALSGTVDIKLEVVDSASAACVLYREVHSNIDVGSVPATQGIFALRLGGGSKLFGPSRLSSVFSNASLVNGDSDGNNANDCTLNPAGGSQRLVRMHVSQDGGSTYSTLSPDTAVTTVPTSMVAETLQGRDLSGFILVDSSGGSHMNQTDIGTVFNSTNFTKLTALLNGTSTQYIGGTPTAAVSLNNQRLTSVADPSAPQDAATKNYSDSFVGGKTADVSTVGAATGNGFTLNWDQTAQKWVAGLPNDATKLPLAGGTMTGPINMGTSNLNATGHITMSAQRILTLGTLTTAQESALSGLSVGASWYNSSTQQYKIWDGTNAVVQASLDTIGRLPASTIPNTTVTAGSYGSALLIPTFTVGSDGRITAATNVAIAGISPSGAAGGDLSGTYPNPTIADGAVTDAKIVSMSVDKITNATGKYLTYKPDNIACTAGQVLKFDGTNWVCASDDNSFSGAAAGGDLAGSFPNPTINAGAVTTAAINDGAVTDVKITSVGYDKLTNSVGKYLNYKPNNTPCGNGQILSWNNGAGRWDCLTNVYTNTTGIGVNTIPSGAITTLGTTPAIFERNDASGSAAQSLVLRRSRSDATSPAANFGTAIQFDLEGFTDTSSATAGWIRSAWSNSQTDDSTSRNSHMTFATADAGSAGERMRIDSKGNVAIGITGATPGARLDINGTGAASSAIIIPRDTTGGRPTTGVNGMMRYNSSDDKFEFYQAGSWINYGTGGGDFMKDGSVAMTGTLKMGGNAIYGNTSSGGHLNLDSTSHATKGYVLIAAGGGNVGIGTTLPSTTLDVAGPIQSSGPFQTSNSGYGLYQSANTVNLTTFIGNNYGQIGTESLHKLALQVNSADRVTILTNGNVGIGTTTPTEKLAVDGVLSLKEVTAPSATSAYGKIYVKNSDSKLYYMDDSGTETSLQQQAFLQNGNDFGTDAILGTNGANNLMFEINNATQLIINTSGQMGLGTTSPSLNGTGRVFHMHSNSGQESLLHFTNATVGASAAAGSYVGYSQNGSGTGPATIVMSQGSAQVVLGNGGAEKMRVDTYGVGIGTTASPTDGAAVGKIKFSAPNGAENTSILAVARGPQGATSGGELQFSTTPRNTNTPAVAMALQPSGTAAFNKNIVQKTQANNTSALDWDAGTVIYSSYDCASNINMANLREGGSYTLIITDTGSSTCSFASTTLVDGSSEGISFRFMPANASRLPASHTIYNFFRANNIVYVTWTTGL